MASLLSELGYPTSTEVMTRRLGVLLNHADYHTLVADEAVVGRAGAGVVLRARRCVRPGSGAGGYRFVEPIGTGEGL